MAVKTGALRHTHQYYREVNGLWHCGRCSHFLPKNVPQSSLIGKKSLCNHCMQEFILDADNLMHDYPICTLCKVERNKSIDPEIKEGIKTFDLEEYMAHKRVENVNKKLDEPARSNDVPPDSDDGSLV